LKLRPERESFTDSPMSATMSVRSLIVAIVSGGITARHPSARKMEHRP
jgi:hypothetical protein